MTIRAFIPNISSVVVLPEGDLRLLFDTTYTGPEILEWSGGNSSAFTHPCTVDFTGAESLVVLSGLITDCVQAALTDNTGLTMTNPNIILPSFGKGLL